MQKRARHTKQNKKPGGKEQKNSQSTKIDCDADAENEEDLTGHSSAQHMELMHVDNINKENQDFDSWSANFEH